MKNTYPWVFWITINKSYSFTKKIRTCRSATFYEILFLNIRISIGQKWTDKYIDEHLAKYGNLDNLKHINDFNKKITKGILIGNY